MNFDNYSDRELAKLILDMIRVGRYGPDLSAAVAELDKRINRS